MPEQQEVACLGWNAGQLSCLVFEVKFGVDMRETTSLDDLVMRIARGIEGPVRKHMESRGFFKADKPE